MRKLFIICFVLLSGLIQAQDETCKILDGDFIQETSKRKRLISFNNGIWQATDHTGKGEGFYNCNEKTLEITNQNRTITEKYTIGKIHEDEKVIIIQLIDYKNKSMIIYRIKGEAQY